MKRIVFLVTLLVSFAFCATLTVVFGQGSQPEPVSITANGQTTVLPDLSTSISSTSVKSKLRVAEIAAENLGTDAYNAKTDAEAIMEQLNRFGASKEFTDVTAAYQTAAPALVASGKVYAKLEEDYAQHNKAVETYNAKVCHYPEGHPEQCNAHLEEGKRLDKWGEALDEKKKEWMIQDAAAKKKFEDEVMPKWKIAKAKHDELEARLKAVQDRLKKIESQLETVRMYRKKSWELLETKFNTPTGTLKKGAFNIDEVKAGLSDLNTQMEKLKASSDVDFDGRKKP